MEIKYLIKFFYTKDKSTLIEYGVKIANNKFYVTNLSIFDLVNRVQMVEFD